MVAHSGIEPAALGRTVRTKHRALPDGDISAVIGLNLDEKRCLNVAQYESAWLHHTYIMLNRENTEGCLKCIVRKNNDKFGIRSVSTSIIHAEPKIGRYQASGGMSVPCHLYFKNRKHQIYLHAFIQIIYHKLWSCMI